MNQMWIFDKCRRVAISDPCPVALRSPLGEVPDHIGGSPRNPYNRWLVAHSYSWRHRTIPDVFKTGISCVVYNLYLPGDGKVCNRDSTPACDSVQHNAVLVRLCQARGPGLLTSFSTCGVGMCDRVGNHLSDCIPRTEWLYLPLS